MYKNMYRVNFCYIFFLFFFNGTILSRYLFSLQKNICHKILIQTNYRHRCTKRTMHLSRVFVQENFIQVLTVKFFFINILFFIYFSFHGSRQILSVKFNIHCLKIIFLFIYLSARTCYENLIFRSKKFDKFRIFVAKLGQMHVFKHRLSNFFIQESLSFFFPLLKNFSIKFDISF